MVDWIKGMKCYLALEKKILVFAAARMNLEGITLNETSDTERKVPPSLSYMWNPKKLSTERSRTMVTREEGKWRAVGQRYKVAVM